MILSPGTEYLRIPKTFRENLLWRKFVMDKARRRKRLREALVDICKHDILFYLNTFAWQYNPKKRGGGEVGPFITWPCQDKAIMSRDPEEPGIIACIENNQDAVIEKSREMGATWLCLFVQDWLCRSLPYQQCLTISKSMEAVEDHSPNSLFWKIDFMHRHLPEWLRGRIERRANYIGYLDSDSVNTGEASTGRAGVGGRASLIFIDEFSQVRDDWEMYHRTAGTCDCRLFNGTHMGSDTAFYSLTRNPTVKKINLHWTQHPDKNRGLYRFDSKLNKIVVIDKEYQFPIDYDFVMRPEPTGGYAPFVRSPWYDRQVGRMNMNKVEIARDLDIDPLGSVSQFFDPVMIHHLIEENTCDPYWEGDLDYDQDFGKPIAFRPRRNGSIRLWLNLDPSGLPPESWYGAGVDVAMGRGRTPSVLSIIDRNTGEKVLEYLVTKLKPFEFAIACVAICRMFASANGTYPYLAWEAQGPGGEFGDKVVKDLQYMHVYLRRSEDKIHKRTTDQYGWDNKPASLARLLGQYRAGLQTGTCVNRSRRALEECLKFEDDGGVIEYRGIDPDKVAPDKMVSHGDIAMADALAWWMVYEYIAPKRRKDKQVIHPRSLAYRRMLADNQSQEVLTW